MFLRISLPSFKGNIAFIFSIDYMLSETNLINVHRCNLFLVFYILTQVQLPCFHVSLFCGHEGIIHSAKIPGDLQLASSSCNCSLLCYLLQAAAQNQGFTKNLYGTNVNKLVCVKITYCAVQRLRPSKRKKAQEIK